MPPFVARDKQKRDFKERLEEGGFTIWSLHGRDGIGKTRLLTEFRRLAEGKGNALCLTLDWDRACRDWPSPELPACRLWHTAMEEATSEAPKRLPRSLSRAFRRPCLHPDPTGEARPGLPSFLDTLKQYAKDHPDAGLWSIAAFAIAELLERIHFLGAAPAKNPEKAILTVLARAIRKSDFVLLVDNHEQALPRALLTRLDGEGRARLAAPRPVAFPEYLRRVLLALGADAQRTNKARRAPCRLIIIAGRIPFDTAPVTSALTALRPCPSTQLSPFASGETERLLDRVLAEKRVPLTEEMASEKKQIAGDVASRCGGSPKYIEMAANLLATRLLLNPLLVDKTARQPGSADSGLLAQWRGLCRGAEALHTEFYQHLEEQRIVDAPKLARCRGRLWRLALPYRLTPDPALAAILFPGEGAGEDTEAGAGELFAELIRVGLLEAAGASQGNANASAVLFPHPAADTTLRAMARQQSGQHGAECDELHRQLEDYFRAEAQSQAQPQPQYQQEAADYHRLHTQAPRLTPFALTPEEYWQAVQWSPRLTEEERAQWRRLPPEEEKDGEPLRPRVERLQAEREALADLAGDLLPILRRQPFTLADLNDPAWLVARREENPHNADLHYLEIIHTNPAPEARLTELEKFTRRFPAHARAWQEQGLLLRERFQAEAADVPDEAAAVGNREPWRVGDAPRQRLAIRRRLTLRRRLRECFTEALEAGITGPRRELARQWRQRLTPQYPAAVEAKEAGGASANAPEPKPAAETPEQGPATGPEIPETPEEPDSAESWFYLGVAQYDAGRYQEALASFDKALALQPDDADAWSNRGAALNELGHHREALASCDKALALQPDDAAAWGNRGNALVGLGRHQEALESYDKALALQPDDATAWNNRGNALNELGRHQEALDSCDKALALRPDDAAAWHNRGVALRKLGHHQEALESYDKALALQPDYAAAWNSRGAVLTDHLSRYEEGLESFHKALALQPDYALAWRNRGNALHSLGRYPEALASYDKALALRPDDAAAWHNRGVAHQRLGQAALSAHCLQTEARIRAIHAGKAGAEQYWQVARDAWFAYGHWVKAREYLIEALARAPGHRGARLLLAEVELEEGNVAAAGAALDWVLEREPDWMEAGRVAARLLLARGEVAAARGRLRAWYDEYGDNLGEAEQFRWLDWFEEAEDGEYAIQVCQRIRAVSEDWVPVYRQARAAWQWGGDVEACEALLEEMARQSEDRHAAVVLLHGELAWSCGDILYARLCLDALAQMDTGELREADLTRWRRLQEQEGGASA
uniref:Tetratricopeptide (TPR) repeat n=1 Tax=Candidatus Kentrum sp. DK TaxID=2126562 RepID=A0A450T0L7_9GAMM|nr:MAG: Tetratricopeptide (TPR) repeat [Candidatus Kentron sp. DK]